MRLIAIYLLCLAVVLAPGCSILSPKDRASARAEVEAAYEEGHITAKQRDAALEAIDNDEPIDWEALGFIGANIVLSLLGAPLVVRKMRGPPTQRVGLPEEKVIHKTKGK